MGPTDRLSHANPLTRAAPDRMIAAVGTRTDLPSGTVTFLFTDIEGSTNLLHALGADGYADALTTHRQQLRTAFAQHGGVEVDTQGDAFFVAFPTAAGALAAARAATDSLADGPVRVRIGIHTGSPLLTDEGYVGPDVHKGARIAAAGHGGQVLVSAATAALLNGAELRDLGEHRLKDLAAPERIFQADGAEHPPLRTLHQTNLPIPATPFLGREAELADLRLLLARDDVRLVTLTGPGGTGKTRLALQAAADIAEHVPGGAWWVPLAALSDPALVLESITQALGASGDLAEHIGDARMLLLLDNFEHLTAAASQLAPLLGACPHLTLLVTSREPLHLAGEHEVAVDPLSRADAVELFLTRALAARRDFTANGEVARICERLDDLPLAIELAAARVKVLSPKDLLERLEQRLPLLAGGSRDAPERQRTLRATIEWSHDLLTPHEQQLFARLAVFRGGWTLEAAEAVVDADLDTLQSLVDKSLVRVRPESGRFWMLETIREFAAERLAASNEEHAMRARHATYLLERVEDAWTRTVSDREAVIAWLGAEHDNVRAAMDWLDANGRTAELVQLTGALWKFWYQTGHGAEGLARLERALERFTERTAHRARALDGASSLVSLVDSDERGEEWLRESMSISEELGDEFGVAHATYLMANHAADRQDWPRAREMLEASRAQFEQLGDDYYVLLAGRTLGWVHREMGDNERSRALYEDTLARARAKGYERVVAMVTGAMAWLNTDEGRLDEARAMLLEAHASWARVDDRVQIAGLLFTTARWFLRSGRPADAVRAVARSTAVYAEIGGSAPAYDEAPVRELLDEARAQLSADAYDEARADGTDASTADVVALLSS